MNTPTGNCCEACKDNIPFMKCNRTCSCHTSPTTIVTPERVANAVHDSLDELYSPTDWRERFREKWEKDTKFVGPKIESFIESEIASAIERTVKTASEMGWESDYSYLFTNLCTHPITNKALKENTIGFIHGLLQSERSNMVKRVRGLKFEIPKESNFNYAEIYEIETKNQACDEVIKILQSPTP